MPHVRLAAVQLQALIGEQKNWLTPQKLLMSSAMRNELFIIWCPEK
jgi:hypothetical protein